MWAVDYFFAPGMGVKHYKHCICMSVLSVCPLAYLKNHRFKFYQIFFTLPVAVSRSDGSAIRYVFSDFWTTSHFHIMKRIGQNQKRHVCFVQFARWRHRAKPAVSDSILSMTLIFSGAAL